MPMGTQILCNPGGLTTNGEILKIQMMKVMTDNLHLTDVSLGEIRSRRR
jgi:hypothetical protein